MALDLHISKNEKEAPYKRASASFELQPHELIFYRFGLPEGKFPLFKRMEDYYKDAKYNSGELQMLIAEVKEIKSLFQENKQLTEQLNSILAACESAQKESLSIWVYCD
jgi:hypothetical protein